MSTTDKRSPLLAFFAFVANVYLTGFAADATVSVLDEAFLLSVGDSPLSGLRNALAWGVVATSVVMLFVITFVPHLPKMVFWPLILAAVWLAFGGPPFGSLTGEPGPAGLFLALCQLALAVAAFLIVHWRTGSFLLEAEALPHLENVFLRIAFASLLALVVGLGGVIAMAATAAVTFAEQGTRGYLDFTWSEVRTRVTTLRNGGKTVLLAATAHIAEPGFYQRLYASVPANAVVLAEGISDRKHLLVRSSDPQEAMAKTLGLSTQDVLEDLFRSGTSQSGTPLPGKPAVERADIDVSELSPSTLRCLRLQLEPGEGMMGAILDSEGLAGACAGSELRLFWHEVLHLRNAKVLSTFDRLATKYDLFVVPWGAMHMPDLQDQFQKRGFRIVKSEMVTLARYETVAGHLFGGLAAFRLHGPANAPFRQNP